MSSVMSVRVDVASLEVCSSVVKDYLLDMTLEIHVSAVMSVLSLM